MKIISKDITTIKSGIILHQVNCQNAMGSGVALALFTKWPIVKELYHKEFETQSKEELFRQLKIVPISSKIIVLNSFSQFDYGTHKVQTDMNLLKNNIKKAHDMAKERETILYLPEFVGCGLAGGNWSELLEYLEGFDDSLVICSIQR